MGGTTEMIPRTKFVLAIFGLTLIAIGIFIGYVASEIRTGQALSNCITLGYWGCQDYWSEKVWQAYEEEEPSVAIWAMNTQIGVVKRQVDLWGDKDPDQAEILLKDIVMMHVQLALLHEKLGNEKAYKKSVAMAFSLVVKICPGRYESEQDLVESVKKYKCGVCAGKSEEKKCPSSPISGTVQQAEITEKNTVEAVPCFCTDEDVESGFCEKLIRAYTLNYDAPPTPRSEIPMKPNCEGWDMSKEGILRSLEECDSPSCVKLDASN